MIFSLVLRSLSNSIDQRERFCKRLRVDDQIALEIDRDRLAAPAVFQRALSKLEAAVPPQSPSDDVALFVSI